MSEQSKTSPAIVPESVVEVVQPPPEDQPEKLTPWEKIQISLNALLQLVPFGVGGAIATSVFGTMAERQRKRVERLIRQLARDVQALGRDKIDFAYFETDEFQSLFRRVLETVVREHQEEKLFFTRNLLVRSLIEGKPEAFDFDAFVLEMIASLTSLHFLCLFEVANSGQEAVRAEAIAPKLNAPVEQVDSVLNHLVSLGWARGIGGAAMVMSPTRGRQIVGANVGFLISRAGLAVAHRIEDLDLGPKTTPQESETKATENEEAHIAP